MEVKTELSILTLQDKMKCKILIKEVQHLIWALKFEKGPEPRGILDNSSPAFFPLIEDILRQPLPWQKIEVAAGPLNDTMYCVLKAAKCAIEQLCPELLEKAKTNYEGQYNLVQPLKGEVKSISNSDKFIVINCIGNAKNQPGDLVNKIVIRVQNMMDYLKQAYDVREKSGHSFSSAL